MTDQGTPKKSRSGERSANPARYRLQRKEQYVLPNILGNHSMPVYSYRWKDIAVCAESEPLEDYMSQCTPPENHRIIDTMEGMGNE